MGANLDENSDENANANSAADPDANPNTNANGSYIVAVRALCEFSAKQGDLDLRFTPSPTAQQGIAGHALVTARRGPGYQREVALSGQFGPLLVRGRADGYDAVAGQLEEIKTFRGDLALMPANQRHLHWAQLRIYGHLLCQQLGLAGLRLALVYFDIASQQETVLTEQHEAAALAQFFDQQCQRFLAWAEREMAHRAARDEQLRALSFPHAGFRTGQRELAEAMFKASSRACCLLAQAPTGIGKTVGSLFPMLKAAAVHGVDKIFFLAAKTSGRQMALDACATICGAAPGLPLRVLELSAKTSACEHPDKACHGESCPLARGFYDRLPAARSAAVQEAMLDKATLRRVALEHQVCPYYLGTELARWCDVVVGDYNYYFDISALLHSLTVLNDWKVNLLVDEAHNMVARARQMYTAQLRRATRDEERKRGPALLKKPLDRVRRVWKQLEKQQEQTYQAYPDLPDKYLAALRELGIALGVYLADHAALAELELQTFYFDVLLFIRLADSFGSHSLFDLDKEAASSTLCIRNIIPAPFLTPRFDSSHGSALFSATLSPWNYYHDTLGLPKGSAWVDVASPFAAQQLTVRLVPRISTRFQHRDASLEPIAALMARQYAEQPGNYLAFFSSFDYMEKVAALLAERCPALPLWRQTRRMDEPERMQFLARFTETSEGIGFAVLGGSFGEGIDLPGARLIGAFIATLGLPQINAVNEQIRLRMQTQFGAGYDYTYLYPGLQKVVQAAGRVIRTTTDRGIVYLIDDRFQRPEVRALLPDWWLPEIVV